MPLPRITRRFVDGPTGQVHVRVAGEAGSRLPLVCLHMSPKSGRSYADVLPHLATSRLAIAPDYPGHGESDPPAAEPPVTIGDFASSVIAVADALDIDEFHVLGHHTGAMVAAELADRLPARVRSVVSISAPVFTDEEIAALSEYFSPIPIDEAGTRFMTMWQRVLDNRGPGMTLAMAADSFAENLRAGDHYEWGHRAAFAYARRYRDEVLGRLRQPVLVINPNDDCAEQTPRADTLLANGRRIDCPNWGHGFLSAYPAEAAQLVNAFIDELEHV